MIARDCAPPQRGFTPFHPIKEILHSCTSDQIHSGYCVSISPANETVFRNCAAAGCGSPGTACCTDSTIFDGSPCRTPVGSFGFVVCNDGICADCGGSGFPCCPGGDCIGSLTCNPDNICTAACGFVGSPCCTVNASTNATDNVAPDESVNATSNGRCLQTGAVCDAPSGTCVREDDEDDGFLFGVLFLHHCLAQNITTRAQ